MHLFNNASPASRKTHHKMRFFTPKKKIKTKKKHEKKSTEECEDVTRVLQLGRENKRLGDGLFCQLEILSVPCVKNPWAWNSSLRPTGLKRCFFVGVEKSPDFRFKAPRFLFVTMGFVEDMSHIQYDRLQRFHVFFPALKNQLGPPNREGFRCVSRMVLRSPNHQFWDCRILKVIFYWGIRSMVFFVA